MAVGEFTARVVHHEGDGARDVARERHRDELNHQVHVRFAAVVHGHHQVRDGLGGSRHSRAAEGGTTAIDRHRRHRHQFLQVPNRRQILVDADLVGHAQLGLQGRGALENRVQNALLEKPLPLERRIGHRWVRRRGRGHSRLRSARHHQPIEHRLRIDRLVHRLIGSRPRHAARMGAWRAVAIRIDGREAHLQRLQRRRSADLRRDDLVDRDPAPGSSVGESLCHARLVAVKGRPAVGPVAWLCVRVSVRRVVANVVEHQHVRLGRQERLKDARKRPRSAHPRGRRKPKASRPVREVHPHVAPDRRRSGRFDFARRKSLQPRQAKTDAPCPSQNRPSRYVSCVHCIHSFSHPAVAEPEGVVQNNRLDQRLDAPGPVLGPRRLHLRQVRVIGPAQVERTRHRVVEKLLTGAVD